MTPTIVAAAKRYAPAAPSAASTSGSAAPATAMAGGAPSTAKATATADGFAGAVVDIGCGVGRTSLALARAGYRVFGVDPSDRAVRLAASTAAAEGLAERAAFAVGDATGDPPSEWIDRFGLAVCSEVIEHVAAPERVVDYARRVLRPGGILILTTPHDRRLWTTMDAYAGRETRFTADELRALLWDFDILEVGTEGFPFPRIAMRTYDRLLRRRGGEHRFAACGDGPAHRVYTRVMPAPLRVDHWVRRLRRGMMLVVVARRRVIIA